MPPRPILARNSAAVVPCLRLRRRRRSPAERVIARRERRGALWVSSGARTRSMDDSQLLTSSAYALPTHTPRMPRHSDAVFPRAHFGKSAILVTFVLPLLRCCFPAFCRFFQHPLLPLLRCRKHITATISDHRAPSVHTSRLWGDNRIFLRAAHWVHTTTPPNKARPSIGHLRPPTRRRLRMCSAMHLFARARHFCRCYAAEKAHW